MARNRKRDRGFQSRLARPFPLDHTASRSRDPFQGLSETGPDSLDDIVEAFSRPPVRTLIRTVLENPRSGFQAPPRRAKRSSPTVSVRATFRSSDKGLRSPFLNATMVTPQLAARALECAKRNIRREVIFATKSTGAGAKARRRRRSKVKC